MPIIDFKELSQLTKPLLEYLKRIGDPYTSIIITEDKVSITQDIASMPIKQ